MNNPPMPFFSGRFSVISALLVGGLCLALAGCARQSGPGQGALSISTMRGVDLTTPTTIAVLDGPIHLAGAGNEWLDFTVQVDASRITGGGSLRISPAQADDKREELRFPCNAYQVLPIPVDLNRASYIRHTGNSAQTRALPRVLLPLSRRDGAFDLSALRDPARPTDPAGRPRRGSVLIWLEVHVPASTRAGNFQITCDLLNAEGQPIASVPVRLHVYDFSLPESPHLRIVSRLDWAALMRVDPEIFEGLTPRLLNRHDPRCASAVRALDQLIELAHANHVEAVVPRLQPTVKWPPGTLPQIDWNDLDSLLSPWMKGDGFSDHRPQRFWPLPSPDYLDNFDPQSRDDYWRLAAAHFDQKGWLDRCPVLLPVPSHNPLTTAESLAIAEQARRILSAYPRVRVALPLEDDQVQQASSAKVNLIEPAAAGQLMTAAPGLVYTAAEQQWPANIARPRHWLPTDGPALLPFASAGGSEQDVRAWAWLAFAQDASLILWDHVLPAAASVDSPGDPAELVWFYPGQWFGIDQPLATLQLKWLRRAQQDYEYLELARQRGAGENAMQVARLITKPVELQPGQIPDPTFTLLSGMADPHAWIEARQLLAGWIQRRTIGQASMGRELSLDLQATRWLAPQQRPTLLVRGVQWLWDTSPDAPAGNWLHAHIDLDIYSPGDNAADDNHLQWTSLAQGWQVYPQPLDVPPLAPCHVQRVTADARFDLNQIAPDSRKPLELTFQNGFTSRTIRCRFLLPIAVSERRTRSVNLDGSLDDWDAMDALQLDQPLVRMLNRPALQKQEIQPADAKTSIYSAWSDDQFYLAFRVNGVDSVRAGFMHNFVDYQCRRAWGEDLCEVLIQPVYTDNTLGPTLHLVCKPDGNWVEREPAPVSRSTEAEQPLEGAGVRYASTVDPRTQIWRGELAIPWQTITESRHLRPGLLRFNFIQHQKSTGQSASWAGPIDYGRDKSLMGLIQLRETRNNPESGF